MSPEGVNIVAAMETAIALRLGELEQLAEQRDSILRQIDDTTFDLERIRAAERTLLEFGVEVSHDGEPTTDEPAAGGAGVEPDSLLGLIPPSGVDLDTWQAGRAAAAARDRARQAAARKATASTGDVAGGLTATSPAKPAAFDPGPADTLDDLFPPAERAADPAGIADPPPANSTSTDPVEGCACEEPGCDYTIAGTYARTEIRGHTVNRHGRKATPMELTVGVLE